MRIKGLPLRRVTELLTGPQVTPEEAAFMANLLIAEGVEDTNQLSFARWCELSLKAHQLFTTETT
jgi:hypothetical protein